MIIDELIKYKKKKIEEHKKIFPDLNEEDITFEMFRKKYKNSYYTYNRPYSIEPFINQIYLSQIIYWDDRHFDAKKLPRLNNNIYEEIKKFPDYDYLNSIAYEMLIRSDKYQNLKQNTGDISNDEMIKEFDQLGIDINDVFDLKKVANYFSTDEVEENFTKSFFSMTLNDLDYGLDRLIEFYVNEKRIYIVDNIDKIVLNSSDKQNRKEIILSRTYKAIPNVTIEEVKAKLSSYYIPVKFNYKTPTQQEKFSMIDANIPLVAIERNFLLSIDDLIPNRIKGTIDFNFTRPLLRFKELPIVDVPLNLNLSKEELIQLVSKLKDDFEEGTVKNPINILYDTKFEFKDLKDITPFKMTRETMAKAFFIYDLYQFINSAVELHKEKLRQFKELDIKEVENQIQSQFEYKEKELYKNINKHKKTKEKSGKYLIEENKRDFKVEKRNLQKEKAKKISELNKKYKKYMMDYNSMEILEDIAAIHELTPYMCKQYLKFMRKYVEELGYKELIIGNKI